jgi:hypothetical protein
MENQIGSAALTMPAPSAAPASSATPAPSPPADPRKNWLVSPVFDLFFLANIGWVVALLPGFAASDGATPVSFWQIYFLTVPHRWLTLALVAFDPDRREGRGNLFLGLAFAAFLLIAGIRMMSGAFLCLLLVDYLWNAWHFASQHAGVLRLYARKAGAGGNVWLERHALRFFLVYVLVRTAGWSTGWLEPYAAGTAWLRRLDLLTLAVPMVLLALEFRDGWGLRPGKRIFLVSVCGLYAALLLSLSSHHTALVLALTIAVAWFHAAEYLAVVTLYARQRRKQGSAGLARQLAGSWPRLLAAFMLIVGIIAVLGEKYGGDFWLALNLWAALLHYAYDGMIWKLRRPNTAQALGVAESGRLDHAQ